MRKINCVLSYEIELTHDELQACMFATQRYDNEVYKLLRKVDVQWHSLFTKACKQVRTANDERTSNFLTGPMFISDVQATMLLTLTEQQYITLRHAMRNLRTVNANAIELHDALDQS